MEYEQTCIIKDIPIILAPEHLIPYPFRCRCRRCFIAAENVNCFAIVIYGTRGLDNIKKKLHDEIRMG